MKQFHDTQVGESFKPTIKKLSKTTDAIEKLSSFKTKMETPAFLYSTDSHNQSLEEVIIDGLLFDTLAELKKSYIFQTIEKT